MSPRFPSRPREARARALRRARRAGFTLVELMISMVVVAVIGAALTRLILAQNRFYDRQQLQRNARNVSRAALNIINADARMIDEGNPLYTATATQIAFRVPWAVGVACGPTTVAILPVDSLVQSESVGSTTDVGVRQANGTYLRTLSQPTGVLTLTPIAGSVHLVCNTAGITPVPGSRSITLPATMGVVTPGTPVMLYRKVIYTLEASTMVPGMTGLYRQVFGRAKEEIVAPLASTSSFQFFNANNPVPGAVTNIAQVSGIRFNLVGASERKAGGESNTEQASLVTSVYFRNRAL